MSFRTLRHSVLAAGLTVVGFSCSSADAVEPMLRREISYQSKQDLFYNFYEGPFPSSPTAHMYISPQPVPPHVGHTYTTYQPFMPHEYLYKHKRSHYAYTPGAGWTRAKVRYKTYGLGLQHVLWKMSPQF
jgi:hypothetical protein